MRALSRNDAVPEGEHEKRGGPGETRTRSRRGCITRLSAGLRIESESDPLYGIEPIRPSPSFCVWCLLTSLVASFLSPSSRASPLSSSTSTSRFPTRNVVSGRTTTTTTSSPLFSLYVLIYIYLRPVSSCRESWRECTSRHSGEKNALEISFARQFIGEKAMPGYR